MATRSTRARLVRILTPIVTAAMLTTFAVASGPSASADDPQARINAVAAQVDDLQMDAANARELVSAAQLKYAGIQKKIATLKKQLAAAQAQVGVASQGVDAMARAAYTTGGTSTMLQAMLADDPTAFLDRAADLETASRIGSAALRRSQQARVKLAQVKNELAQQEAAAAAALQEAKDQQQVINDKLGQAQKLLATLKEAERQRLLEEQRKKEEAQRQAALAEQKRIADEQAREAAARNSSSNSGNSGSSSHSGSSGNSGSSGSNSGSSGGSGGGSYTSDKAQVAVQYALSQVGKPYSYSANPPSSWDCSKLTSWAWKQAGVYLTPYSFSQRSETRSISRSEVRPGDLLFYFGMGAHHVGIYIGGGKMVDAASPSRGVQITDAWGSWYGERYSGAGRPG